MIGTLLPWAYYKRQVVSPGQSTDELLPATGGAFDGEIAFALGSIAIVLALVTRYRPSTRGRLITTALFVWAAWIAFATMDLLSPTPPRSLPEDFFVVPGYGVGLIITLIAAVGGALVSFVWLLLSARTTNSQVRAI